MQVEPQLKSSKPSPMPPLNSSLSEKEKIQDKSYGIKLSKMHEGIVHAAVDLKMMNLWKGWV